MSAIALVTSSSSVSTFIAADLLGSLADAFGGYSQFSDEIAGGAIAGHFRNRGRLTGAYLTADEAVDAVVEVLQERWADLDEYQETAAVRARVVAGYLASCQESAALTSEEGAALLELVGGYPVMRVPGQWDGNGVPEGARGTMLAGRVGSHAVYGVCSGQQNDDGSDEIESYEVWPSRTHDERAILGYVPRPPVVEEAGEAPPHEEN